jgi:hypothetical protein
MPDRRRRVHQGRLGDRGRRPHPLRPRHRGVVTPGERARPHSSLDYLMPNEFVAQGATPAPRHATGRDAAVYGASAPRPLLNRPRGDKCSKQGKPSQANRGPKNLGRSLFQLDIERRDLSPTLRARDREMVADEPQISQRIIRPAQNSCAAAASASLRSLRHWLRPRSRSNPPRRRNSGHSGTHASCQPDTPTHFRKSMIQSNAKLRSHLSHIGIHLTVPRIGDSEYHIEFTCLTQPSPCLSACWLSKRQAIAKRSKVRLGLQKDQ